MSIGLIILIATMIMGIFAWWGVYHFYIKDNPHSYFAFPVLILILLVAFTGIMSRYFLTRTKWDTKKALIIKWFHKILAYVTLISGCAAIGTGIGHYRRWDTELSVKIEYIVVAIYLCLIALLELIYLRCLKNEYYLG